MRESKKLVFSVLCLLGMFVAGFVGRGFFVVDTSVQAQSNSNPGRCSNRTLNGAYGIKFEGQKIGT